MLLCLLLAAIFTVQTSKGENEEFQTVCVGKEFRLPVYSASRIVTFRSNSPPGQSRVLLEGNDVKDPRFEWTRDRMLVLKEATHNDQGLYSIKLSFQFTYETVNLTVSECIKSFRRNYGETFQHSIPENGHLLDFTPKDSLSESKPMVLWNRTDPETGQAGRGRLWQDGKIWAAERVTQADQGHYTLRDENGNVLTRIALIVHGHTFNVTRFAKESLNLPLFLPVPNVHLIFTPTRYPDESSLGPFDPRPPRGPVKLIREGHVVDLDMRYRGLIYLGRNGSTDEVVITRLTARHDGMYDIRDLDGNLVSSTSLQVIEKAAKWRSVLRSISVPSGMFVSLAGFILFMKRYPNCSLSQILPGLRANHTPPANAPTINVQAYSHPSPQPSNMYGHSPQPGTPQNCSPKPTPSHMAYTPVMVESESQLSPHNVRPENQEGERLTDLSPSIFVGHTFTTEEETANKKRTCSFSVPGESDCLHLSEDCVQFQIQKEGDKERQSKVKDYFFTLPLDTDTSESCSVYTSDKLNFL